MKRKTDAKSSGASVPKWLLTYNDVITLLLTFFILLWTFSTQEPEVFEQMMLSVFGDGNSDGVAGKKEDALDRLSITVRERAMVSRLTSHGSVDPPIYTDIERNGIKKALKSLEERSDLAQYQRVTFSAARSTVFESNGDLSQLGKYQARTLAKQLVSQNLRLQILVADESSSAVAAVKMAEQMTIAFGVPLGRIAVGASSAADSSVVKFTLTREGM